MTEELINTKTLGKLLGIHWRTVIRMVERGELPGYKVGEQWRFKRSEIEDYLRSRRYPPASDAILGKTSEDS